MTDEEKQMRDRLISMLCGTECAGSDRREGGCGYRDSEKCNRIEKLDYCMIACIADNLLANGVIVPPCNAGDAIYLPWQFDGLKGIAYLRVTHIIFESEKNYVVTDFETDNQIYYDKYKGGAYEFEDFGKTVFLTREEAEQALKGEAHEHE